MGARALIAPERTYKQQLKVYESQTRDAGLYRMHGLRHAYALKRYEELTGWKAPAAGGPSRRSLTGRGGGSTPRRGARSGKSSDIRGSAWRGSI